MPAVNVTDEALVSKARPTAPVFWFLKKGSMMSLPVTDMEIQVQFHVSTATVHMKGVWVNSEPKSINALFAMPIEGTVTGCRVKVGANKLFCTAVVDKNNTLPQQQTPTSGIPQISTDSQYMPDLFRMPIENIGAGAQLEVVLDAIVPLNFVNYKYELNLPLTFSPGVLPTTKTVNDVVRISCLVNTVIPNLQVASNTHELAITRHDNICRMDVIARQPTVVNQTGMACQQSTDFHFAYSILSPGIIASNFIQPDVRDAQGKEHGTFALFVTPPQLKQQQEVFGRNFVFLMDCSGSMRGEPWQQAIAGLRSALAQLTTLDRFTVWAFDHRVMKLYETVVVPTMQTINQAIAWCEAIPCTGGTNIGNPLSEAVLHLHHLSTSSSYRDTTTGQVTADRNRHSNTPFVFLITDGAVSDEKEVCKWAEANHSNVRVSTFGIGTYCNWFFLRMLAEKCRGFFDAVVYSGNIGRKIDRLMGKASAPVMLNISLDLPGVEYVELYPNPIPDLFMGAPLLISGRYVCQGTFPAQLKLLGTTLQGPTEVVVNCKIQPSLPVNKVFLKAQIDTLTAHAWLTDSEEIKNQIKALSIAESMPSYYTQMVAYQTTPQQQAAMDEQLAKEEEKRSGKKRDESKTKSGTVSGVNPALVAGACVGGVVVIGAAVMFAGDIAGTLGNLPMVDMIGLGGDVIDMLGVGGGCCSCVLEAAGVCCDCDLCMTVCEHGVDCLEGASGWICGALNGGICDVAGEIFGCCGQVVQHIAKIL